MEDSPERDQFLAVMAEKPAVEQPDQAPSMTTESDELYMVSFLFVSCCHGISSSLIVEPGFNVCGLLPCLRLIIGPAVVHVLYMIFAFADTHRAAARLLMVQ